MLDVARQVQAAYDQIAPVYADRNGGPLPENLVVLAEKLVRHVGKAGRIAEIGCGVGRDMAWFEAQGIRVTGCDLSAGMLAYARQVVKGDLLLMDMRQLAFPDALFQGTWSCASLLHLPKQDAPQALREMRRILKPGGMLVLSVQAGSGQGWEGGYVEGVHRFFARYTADEMQAMLADCGFAVMEHQAVQAEKREWLSFVGAAA